MSKNLKTVQVFAKLGKIISMILFIFCIIGAVGCLFGAIGGLVIDPDSFRIDSLPLDEFVKRESGETLGSVCAACGAGFIICIAEAIKSKLAHNYFKYELDCGTPFTFDGARKMNRLGIYMIIFTCAGSLLAGIVEAVLAKAMDKAEILEMPTGTGLLLGAAFIALSFVIGYGAELAEKNKEEE